MIPPLFLPLLALCALLSTAADFRDDDYFKSLTGLEACSSDNKAACFFPDFCGPQGTSSNALLLYRPGAMQLSHLRRCPAVAIFKKFTDRKWLVILLYQENRDGTKEMQFKIDGGGLLFGCKSDDGITVAEQPGLFKTDMHYKIVRKFGMLCKGTVEGDLRAKLSTEQRGLQLDTPTGSYTYSAANVAYPIISNTGKCDASRLTFHEKSLDASETSLWPLVEFDKVRCPDGSKLKMVPSGVPVDVTVECNDQGSPKKYDVKSGGKVSNSGTNKFACTTKTCTRCGDIDLPQGAGPKAVKPQFTAASGEKCADLACENDRIELPGMNATVAKPFCKQFAPGDFRWTIKVHGEERAFLAAACPNMVRCNDVQPLRDFCDSPSCSQLSNTWLRKVNCEGEHRIATKPEGGDWSLISGVECDEQRGVWMKVAQQGAARVKLETNEKIKCLTSEKAAALQDQSTETTTQNSDAAPSTGGGPFPTGGYIAIVLIVVIVMMIIFGFVFYKIHKRKKAEEEALEVDAKPPTPPASAGDSEAAGGSGAEVSFSGTKREQQTPSLKSAKTDWASAPKQFVKAELPPPAPSAPASTTQTFEAAVSVTAPITDISDGTSSKPTPPPAPSDKSIPKPADPSSGPKPSSDVSKKKLKELLDQSLPSMSE